MMNNEHDFARRIGQTLNAGTQYLDSQVSQQLMQARQRALQHQRRPVGLLSLAGIGRLLSVELGTPLRTLLILLAMMAAIFGMSYWNTLQSAAELEEVDSALLADDLPLDAYIDHGFDAWLSSSDDSAM